MTSEASAFSSMYVPTVSPGMKTPVTAPAGPSPTPAPISAAVPGGEVFVLVPYRFCAVLRDPDEKPTISVPNSRTEALASLLPSIVRDAFRAGTDVYDSTVTCEVGASRSWWIFSPSFDLSPEDSDVTVSSSGSQMRGPLQGHPSAVTQTHVLISTKFRPPIRRSTPSTGTPEMGAVAPVAIRSSRIVS